MVVLWWSIRLRFVGITMFWKWLGETLATLTPSLGLRASLGVGSESLWVLWIGLPQSHCLWLAAGRECNGELLWSQPEVAVYGIRTSLVSILARTLLAIRT